MMKNENDIKKQIIERLKFLARNHGASTGIVCLQDPNHACSPGRDNFWRCSAVSFFADTGELSYGIIEWDFYEDKEDVSEYDFDFGLADYKEENVYTIDDVDDLSKIREILGLKD